MAEEEHPLELAAIAVGSPVGGAILGVIIGTAQSGTENAFGVTEYALAINSNAGYLATAVGWLLGALYEAIYRDNVVAAAVLIPLAALVVLVAVSV